jgi:hypothetical protein
MDTYLEKLANGFKRHESSEQLKLLGKRAANLYMGKEAESLNDAVRKAVSSEGLNKDQIQRVSEMANQATWQSMFVEQGDKETSFDPADASSILDSMSEKPDVAYEPMLDYHLPPEGEQVADDIDLASAFGIKADDTEKMDMLNPSKDAEEAVEKTAAALDIARYGVDRLLVDLNEKSDSFYNMVKQAHLRDGHGILQISRAVGEVLHSDTFALDLMNSVAGRLAGEGVTINQKVELEKLSHPLVINTEHPLLVEAAILEKLAFSYYSATKAHENLKKVNAEAHTYLRDKTRGV